MEQSPIRVSAILPNYNDSSLLPRALDSLLKQKSAIDEIIVIDDASTDESLSLIRTYMNQYPAIQLIAHETNQGVSAALNAGIACASGDYVILCAADDWYDEKMVETARRLLSKTPQVGLICGDAEITRFDLPHPFTRTLPYPREQYISGKKFQAIAMKRYVGFNSGGGMLLRRESVLAAHGLYPALRWHSDWFLYIIVAMRDGFVYADQLFIHINMRKTSYSEGKSRYKTQRQVLLDMIAILKRDHADLWESFKRAALLPHYTLKYWGLFLWHRKARTYLTSWLLWKCFINNRVMIKLGRLFPYTIILKARSWLGA